MSIAYTINNSLYLNITNYCTNNCTFCIRNKNDIFKNYNLRLESEPTDQEIIQAIKDPSLYDEIVFCGYGEPLSRFNIVKVVSLWIKDNKGKVRINTNGHGNIINKRNILLELEGLIDSISISLNSSSSLEYNKICKPNFINAFSYVIDFIEKSINYIPKVQLTIVDTGSVSIPDCQKLARLLKAPLKIRTLLDI